MHRSHSAPAPHGGGEAFAQAIRTRKGSHREKQTRKPQKTEGSPEHSNLVYDVVPISGRLELLREQLVKLLPHVDNTTRHRLDILFPVRKQLRVIQNQRYLVRGRANEAGFGVSHHPPCQRICCVETTRYGNVDGMRQRPACTHGKIMLWMMNVITMTRLPGSPRTCTKKERSGTKLEGANTHQTRTVRRRVANLAAREDRELTLHAGGGLVGRGDDVQRSDALAVQSSVLRETLQETDCISNAIYPTVYSSFSWSSSSLLPSSSPSKWQARRNKLRSNLHSLSGAPSPPCSPIIRLLDIRYTSFISFVWHGLIAKYLLFLDN